MQDLCNLSVFCFFLQIGIRMNQNIMKLCQKLLALDDLFDSMHCFVATGLFPCTLHLFLNVCIIHNNYYYMRHVNIKISVDKISVETFLRFHNVREADVTVTLMLSDPYVENWSVKYYSVASSLCVVYLVQDLFRP